MRIGTNTFELPVTSEHAGESPLAPPTTGFAGSGNGDSPRPPVIGGSTPDPFDPASLRLSQDFASLTGVRKILTTVPVSKPNREWFVRVHPSDEYQLPTAVIELKEDREIYIVAPDLRESLASEPTFGYRQFATSITRQGTVFLWPLKMAGANGKQDKWSESAMVAAAHARVKWIRVSSDMQLGAYEIYEATGSIPEPSWPDVTFSEILHVAFREKLIDRMDHPVLRKLRGEV